MTSFTQLYLIVKKTKLHPATTLATERCDARDEVKIYKLPAIHGEVISRRVVEL